MTGAGERVFLLLMVGKEGDCDEHMPGFGVMAAVGVVDTGFV